MRILFLLLFLASCAHQQDFNMPVHRFETPEVAGNLLGGGAELGFTGSQKVILNKIYPHVFEPGVHTLDQDKAMEQNGAYALNLRLGLHEMFDVAMRDRGDAPTEFGVKWQFKGKGRNAKARGWKMALAIFGGKSTQESDNDDEIRVNSVDYESTIELATGELDFMVGYRSSEHVLLYGTTHSTWYDVDGELKATGQQTLKTEGWTWQYGQALGVELSTGVGVLKLETAVARGSYRNIVSRTDFTFGAVAGVAW